MAQEASFEENPALALMLGRFVKYAEGVFVRAVESSGLVVSGELRDSIRAQAVEHGKGFIRGSVVFSELMRIKDMKELRYTTVPPLTAMVNFVEKVGIGKFHFVPGYGHGVRPVSEHAAVMRVARGLQFHFKSYPNVTRRYRGIYNEQLKNEILPTFFSEMQLAASQFVQQQTKELFGKALLAPLADNSRNWARIMASRGSYEEGKINTSTLHLNFGKS
ncbi:hypothetical protein [Siphonobacter sp. SORGH_AS_0500]|uniref:hypothetical protein n=1 Tax=Siphonobacter sp. SORGH_AS_0500 TaxID=1864824 RepID=UPI00285BE8F4|nr:hypothetical protein [Siphonobacter sp. SORGH_AS_0500]MDR6195923.1 hypothetical protein [Siphonobacter sp. SORGH_AS_0500]